MEFVEEKKDNGLSNILLLALGAVAFYYIFVKPRQQTQTISSKQSQSQFQQSQQEPISTYNNEESWEIIRGEDGHITNLRVARDATVGNGTNMYNSHEKSSGPNLYNLDNLDNLDKTIKEMIQKNMQDMSQFNQRFANMKINDDERKRRYGFN